jgi:hypothetical protein
LRSSPPPCRRTASAPSSARPRKREIQCANLNDAQQDLYNGTVIVFLTGALAGSRATVTDYVKSGDNGVFTISSQPTTASAGDLIVLF